MNSRRQLIPVLDMFRLVAALLVVLVHYELIFGQFVIYGAMATTALSWFFVLSGFIIAYNYPSFDSLSAIRSFYAHRIIRIYPTYFLAVLGSAALVSFGHVYLGENYFVEVNRAYEISYDLPADRGSDFWWGATLRHLTFTQSIGPMETLKTVFNGPLWSLVLEMYFYFLFPLLIVILKPINGLVKVILALIGTYLLQFLLIQYYLPDVETYNAINLNVTVYTNPVIRGLEFIFGILIYKAFLLFPAITKNERLNLFPLLITMVAYVGINAFAENYLPAQYRLYFAAVPFVVVMLLAMTRFHWYPTGFWLKFCAWCGGVSYVIYCFHWPLMELIQLIDLVPSTVPTFLHLPIVLMFLLSFSWWIYKFIETPVRKFLYQRYQKFNS